MAPIKTSWTRLIRFVAAETSQVHLGQPIDHNIDVGRAAHENQTIQAHEIIGSSAFDLAAHLTDRVLTVKALLSPISREQCGVIRCLGLNYADHAAESNMQKPNVPVVFTKPPTALTGPLAPITVPKVAQPIDKHQPDFEVELVVVVGKPAKNVPESEILDYVLGYSCGNDVSFRFHQMNVSQWDYSKGFDDTTPIGPCIVAAHALSDPQTLGLKTVLNGEVMQNGHTKEQLFTVKQALSFLSQGTTLLPGNMLMTGTPAGVGFTRKPPVVLKHGDVVEVSIEGGIGTLINKVVEEGK